MREARRFSIEPYVNQGGILGSELQINPRAVSNVMTRGAFYKDIYVSRGSGDKEGTMPQGQHELALLKFKIPTFSSTSRKSSLRDRSEGWFVDIHDQEIHQDVDQKMSKHFKATPGGTSGTEEFKSRYLGSMNDEIQKRLAQVFHKEKRNRLIGTSMTAGIIDGAIAISGAGIYFGGKMAAGEITEGLKSLDASMTDILRFSIGLAALRLGTELGILAALDSKNLRNTINKHTSIDLQNWEMFIPNFQARNLVLGEIAIRRNGNKTVQLRPQE